MSSEARPSTSIHRPVPLRSHRKSRTGCLECKRRKVKCDERRPLCRKCERHFRNIEYCEWPDTVPATTAVRTSPGRLRSSLSSEQARQRRSPPQDFFNVPGAGLVDPFVTYPTLSQDPYTDTLLKYCKRKVCDLGYFIYKCFPFFKTVTIVDTWWPFVRDDQLLTHVMLRLSAHHLEDSEHAEDRYHSKKLKQECTSLLRDRVFDAERASSDHTLAAIATLIAIEHERGDVKLVKLHTDGLKRIVLLRGGLKEVVAQNPIIAVMIYWASLMASSEPMELPFTFPSDRIILTSLQPVADPIRFDFSLLNLTSDYTTMFHDADNITQRFSTTILSADPEESIAVVRELTSLLQRIISLDTLDPTLYHPTSVYAAEACRMAVVLHIFFPLSGNFPDPTLFAQSVVSKLKSNLSILIKLEGTQAENRGVTVLDEPLAAGQVMAPPLLKLWLLAVGGVSAWIMVDRKWFVAQLIPVMDQLDVRSWEDMRRLLAGFIWHAIFCENAFLAVYMEAAAKRESLSIQTE